MADPMAVFVAGLRLAAAEARANRAEQCAEMEAKRADKAEAERDALLTALKLARSIIGHPDDAHSQMIDAAIAKAEGGGNG